jgi:hypothetical protein
MEMDHDWRELASVMAYYTFYDDAIKRGAWKELCVESDGKQPADAKGLAASIRSFMNEHGDAEIDFRNH